MNDLLDKLTKTQRKIQVDEFPDPNDPDDFFNSEKQAALWDSILKPLAEYYNKDDDKIETTDVAATTVKDTGWIPDGDWRQYFPMSEFRQHQEATIDAILKGWRSGKRYAIVEGPTGSGKSLWAVALARFFNHTFIATPQKMLQNQYMKDFSDYLFELKGRATYPCLRINHSLWREGTGEYEMRKGKSHEILADYVPTEGVDYISLETWNELDEDDPIRSYDCSNAPCTRTKIGDQMKMECKQNEVCEYIRRRDHALHRSKITLMNFANLILFSLLMPSVYRKRSLLILDECHTIESYLYNYATINIGVKQLKPVMEHFDSFDDYERITKPFTNMEEFVLFIKDIVIPACERYDKASQILEKEDESLIVSEEQASKDEFMSDLFSRDERKRLKVLVKKLKDFIAEQPTDHSHVIVVEKTSEGKNDVVTGVKIRPFSVAKLGPSLAMSSSDSRVLLMSATILDAKTFCRSLGIPSSEAFFIQVPSTFPAENRLIVGDLSVGSMSYRNKEKTLPAMLDRIQELTEKHEMHKGIIHTGSYEFMNKFKRFAQDTDPILRERILCQTKGTFEEKDRLIKLHMSTDEPTILVGPGFLEGIDLKDDLARFNIIMKMPYMSLADLLIKRKAEEFPEWYDLQTALSLIQAIGRSVRSPTDWSVIYILDLMWKFFYGKHKDRLFPYYIQEAVRWISKRYPIPFV